MFSKILQEPAMFVLSPSLQWRIAIFGLGLMLMILPDSLRLIARGLMALSVIAALFWLLRPVSSVSYQPEDWLMWVDIALSWPMLLAYALSFGLIGLFQGEWWSYLAASMLIASTAVVSLCWYGFKDDDDMLA